MKNEKNNELDLLIVIVDYFKADRVVESVKLLQEQVCNRNYRIVILDNSVDADNSKKLQSLVRYDNVKLIVNEKNLGYTKGCNFGASVATSKYIALLNPDILIDNKNSLEMLIDEMEKNNSIGVLGTRQINDNGMTPDSVRGFPNLATLICRRTPLRRLPRLKEQVEKYECINFDYSQSQNVEWIQSSFVIIRRDLWNLINGLDEKYFLFMSDIDICYYAWQLGYKVRYTADIEVKADGQRCSAGGLREVFFDRALQIHIKDAIIYELKNLFRPKLKIDL